MDAGSVVEVANRLHNLGAGAATNEYEHGSNDTYHECAAMLRALLPPQKSALHRAIEMVENSGFVGAVGGSGYKKTIGQLLALLREAEKEGR